MRRVIALDIETTGLSPWRDEIHMCGIWDGETYTALRDKDQTNIALAQYFRDGYDVVGHRTDFDIKFLLVKGWLDPHLLICNNVTIHDTRIIGSLLKQKVPKAFLDQYEIMRKEENKKLPKGISHREGSPLSLKVMAPWYLKIPPFWETPGDHNNEQYNQFDCMYTYRLFMLLGERLKEENGWYFYMKRMLPWTEMLRDMEIKGISIDLNELDLVEKEYLEKRDHLKNQLDEMWMGAHQAYRFKQENDLRAKYHAMYEIRKLKLVEKGPLDPHKGLALETKYFDMCQKAISKGTIEPKINFASPVQMAWLLKEHLGLDIVNMEGEESTGKAVLHRLAQDRADIKTYLDWREADKVLTMYIPTYKELQIDGVIHPNFNLTGTRTGRTSSSGPNLQQVPAKLYRLFKPRTGHNFVQYDLSGIEAALIALYSGDKKLYEILEKGESIHDHNAKAMFNLSCDVAEVSTLFPKERKTVKNIGFACFYGAGWRRISQVFSAGGFPITDQEAKGKLKLLKSYYPQVFEFHKEITEVFEQGNTIENLLGRPITVQVHENPYMQGFNTLIQSSASDLNLEACYRFSKDPSCAHAHPLLVIHDCVMAEAPKELGERAAERLVGYMTNFKLESEHGPIKLRVEGGVSERWEK